MTEAQKKQKVKAMYRRWLEDEKLLDEIAERPEPQFSDLSEIMNNLGTAIAYAQAYVNRVSSVSRPKCTWPDCDQPSGHDYCYEHCVDKTGPTVPRPERGTP